MPDENELKSEEERIADAVEERMRKVNDQELNLNLIAALLTLAFFFAVWWYVKIY